MKIKHVFFDLDHTLWDFETNSAKTFEKIFKLHKVEMNLDKFLIDYKKINFEYWRLFRNDLVTKEELRYKRLKDTFDILKFPISDELINCLSDDYINYLSTFNFVFEGTIEILEYLKPKYTLHIITNGFSEVQSKKMKNSKLDVYFDQIITSESVGVKKPNPVIFEYALSQANARIEESVMIGDSWEADIMGAKNVGMKPIFCNFEKNEVDNSILSIQHLIELKKYL
jgi:putative hydrolase of the HAD superfamily